MDDEESLISEAIRRRSLPVDHPEHLDRAGYLSLMAAGIEVLTRSADALTKEIQKLPPDKQFI